MIPPGGTPLEHVVGGKPVRASEKTWSHECGHHFAFGLKPMGGTNKSGVSSGLPKELPSVVWRRKPVRGSEKRGIRHMDAILLWGWKPVLGDSKGGRPNDLPKGLPSLFGSPKPVRASEKMWYPEWPPQGHPQCALVLETRAGYEQTVVSQVASPMCVGARNQCGSLKNVVSQVTSTGASAVCFGPRNQGGSLNKCVLGGSLICFGAGDQCGVREDGLPSGLPRGLPKIGRAHV